MNQICKNSNQSVYRISKPHKSLTYHFTGSHFIIPAIITIVWVGFEGTPSNIIKYIMKNLCTKIGTFVCSVTIISLSHLTIGCHNESIVSF